MVNRSAVIEFHGGSISFSAFLVLALLLVSEFSLAASTSKSNSRNLSIPDAGSWVFNTIEISDAPSNATITSVEVYFNAKHPYSGDLQVDLEVGTYSNSKRLWDNAGGSEDNPSGTVTTSNFNGLPVNNTWYLYARDTVGGDSGYIDKWTIEISYSTPTAPSISSVSPSSLSVLTSNQTLTIEGSDFGSAATLVFDPPTGPNISSTSYKFTSRTSNQLVYQFNHGGDDGTWRVRVSNPGGQNSAWHEFTVTPEATTSPTPSISSVSPPSMSVSTYNQNLTISGEGFDSAATLVFDPPTGSNINSTSYKFTSRTSNQLVYQFNHGGDDGTWRVRVSNPSGTDSGWYEFTVTPEATTSPTPSISSVSPNSMPASSPHQTLTVNGSGFDTAAILVFDPPTGSNINSISYKFTSRSSSQLVYQFYHGNDEGTWRVKVSNPGSVDSAWQNFTVTAETSSSSDDNSANPPTPTPSQPSGTNSDIASLEFGSFPLTIRKGSLDSVGVIHKGVEDVYIMLDSNSDLDIELYDRLTGDAIVSRFNGGILTGRFQQTTNYAGTEVVWSGYGGDGALKPGREHIRLAGLVTRDLDLKVYGFEDDVAHVNYFLGIPTPINRMLEVVYEGKFFDLAYNNGVKEADWAQHLGTDYRAPGGTLVRAISSGTIVYCETSESDPFNSAVIVEHADGTQLVYGHVLSERTMLSSGNCGAVNKGDIVGEIQNDLGKYRAHLHLGLNILGNGLPEADWGWGRAPFSTERTEAEAKGWIDVNEYFGAPN